MKIQPYIEKLNASPEFKVFKEKYKDAFLAAGFFVIDFEMGQNIHQIDYYIPSQKKFAAFGLDDKVNFQIVDSMMEKAPERLDIKTKIDLEALKGIIEDEMRNRSMTEDIRKIIAVLQSVKGKKIWNVNSVLSGMEILKVHVEDDSKTILKMEKTSFMDIMKKIPMEQLKAAATKMQGSGSMPAGQEEEGENIAGEEDVEEETGEEAIEELQKLDQLEKKIEEEKVRLKKKVVEDEKKNDLKASKSVVKTNAKNAVAIVNRKGK